MKKLLRTVLQAVLALKLYWILFDKYHSLLFFLFRIFPIKKNKIVFCNFAGKGFGDNPKYVAQEMITQNLDVDIVWLNNEVEKFPLFSNKIRQVNARSIRAKFELVTSKIWIDNCRKPLGTRKRKLQYYIQTWHAGIMLKKVEKDAEDKLSLAYIMSAKNDSKMIDVFISNSKFCTELYKTSFWYHGEILECGLPKTDILMNHCQRGRDKVRLAFGINSHTNIALYAPTFRVNHNVNVYSMQYNQLNKELRDKFGGEWVIFVRLHPNMADKSGEILYSDEVLNASSYDDMQELMLASNIMITDYSSTMFEFSLIQRPVFLYALDLSDYIKDRGFYINFSELPFPIAEDMDQLRNNIRSFDYAKYSADTARFMKSKGIAENGTASKEIVARVIEVMDNNKKKNKEV